MIAISSWRLWVIALFGVLCAAVALSSRGLSLDMAAAAPDGALLLSLIVLTRFKAKVNIDWLVTIISVAEGIGLFTITGLVGTVMTYAVAAASVGYVDSSLAAADLALGFDWMGAYRLVQEHELLSTALVMAYKSMFWTPLVLIILHVKKRDDARLRVLLCVFSLSLFVTVIFFYWLPAQSAVPYYLGDHTSFNPPSGTPTFKINLLRDGGMKVIDINAVVGLITFPSFHAVSAVIFIWGALPFRKARKVLIPLNVLMLVATPIQGSHYLVDIISGSLLAVACISLAYVPAIGRVMAKQPWRLRSATAPTLDDIGTRSDPGIAPS